MMRIELAQMHQPRREPEQDLRSARTLLVARPTNAEQVTVSPYNDPSASGERIVQLTDWLPPEFSAVSQYAILIAEGFALKGAHVTIVGLNSSRKDYHVRKCGSGSVAIVSVLRSHFNRNSWAKRLIWTFGTNVVLLRAAWMHMRRANTIRFLGSPPFLLHFLIPANLLLRKKLVYRITDFYPECIIAAVKKRSVLLEIFLRVTNWLRRRVDAFEVIGEDMRARLIGCGVDPQRITLRRDSSPVLVSAETTPLPRPPELGGRKLLLYSGNWGVAHEMDTFFEGYRRHYKDGSGSVMLWLNATGSGAEEIDARLRQEGLPYYRQKLVPLEQLPNLLVTADAHLITLRPEFAGYVLPSKVYGCIASRRPILFIGPKQSDVHILCASTPRLTYTHIDVGRPTELQAALESLGCSRHPLA
ncbi:MAG: hypothetical protein ACJ8F3_11255 [Xanthobacteraceae bacterium]